MLVGQNLEFDVARALNEFLHIKVAVAESVGGFGLGGLKELRQLGSGTDDAHTPSTAAGRSLEDDGETNARGPLRRLFVGLENALRTRKNGHLRLLHGLPG